jgi:fructuronate reductase
MTSRRLSNATLGDLPAGVIRPAYDRAKTGIGVVHFGPGAFHRAHQAFFFDRMLAANPSLAISAVSLRSDDLRAALAPQDGLYSLVEREAEPAVRVIGSIREVLTAPRDPDAVFARLADPAVRYVTITVTEKGYCLTPDGALDFDHPDVRHDLARPAVPRTIYGWLAEGLRRRLTADRPADLTVLSCDNLSGNGPLLAGAVRDFATALDDPGLSAWIGAHMRFPATMVDSITPATDDALRADAERRLGLVDAWPIQRERFVQWVVGDGLPAADRGLFEDAGVTLARDVAAYEHAKLRLLNGAHSTLAYTGLLLGHATVAQAMADRELAGFIETLMRADIAPTLGALDMDVPRYIGAILARFANPAIEHRLAQIAWDGSQKLPIRLLSAIEVALHQGGDIRRLAVGVAAWMAFVRRQAQAGAAITDPLAPQLRDLGRACVGQAAADVARFLTVSAIFPPGLARDPRFVAALEAAYRGLIGPSPREAL